MIAPWYQVTLATVTKVVGPDSADSKSKKRLEYDLLSFGKDGARTEIRSAVQLDRFADADDYEYRVLRPGARVVVVFPKGEVLAPIIIGCLTGAGHSQKLGDGVNWTRRFQEITSNINRFGEWSVTSDDGPNIRVEKEIIILDASNGQKITIDKTNKKITVDAGDFNVTVTGNATINVTGNVTLSCDKATITAKGNADVSCKDLNVTAKGKANIKASGKVSLKGSVAEINGSDGDILTTTTQPTCYVTGIPFQGSSKAKAGS